MRQKFTFLIYVLTFVAAFQDLLAEKMPCLGDPPKMENGNAVIYSRLHGHYIRYKCHDGTTRTKIGSVRCHDGAWIGHPPKCELLPCLLDPPKIENGRAVIDKRHHGHYIRYECQGGTKEIKVGSIQCLNGTWTGETPNCDFESCQSDPPIVENGRPIIVNRNHGTYIIYECHHYAKTTNAGSVHCHNGIWKGELPKCEFRFSPCVRYPPKFENAKALSGKRDHGRYITLDHWFSIPMYRRYEHGYELSYECQEGTKLIVPGYVYCHWGDWITDKAPKCGFPSDEEFTDVDEEQTTASIFKPHPSQGCFYGPPKVENGRPVIEKRDHGHHIWYECLGGSKKTEEGNVYCLYNFWRGKRPKCEFPICLTKDLNFTNLITPVQESVKSSKSLEVHCKEGYQPARNAQVITCISGEWNITEDPCIEENTVTDADCMTEDLSNFNLVTPFQDSVESSKSLDVQCKEGYKPARKAITCMNGSWNITADPCIEENIINGTCLGDPPEIENGRTVIIDRDDGYIVWYKCEEGRIRTKFGDVRCKDGNWVGSPPRCAYPVCLTRDSYYPNMVMPSKEFVESSTSIDIVCKEGYRPYAYAKVITCIGGEWNITQDPCIEEEVSADIKDKFEDFFRVMTIKSF